MNRISIVARKWLLTLHLLFSAIMLGVTIAFLMLSIKAAATDDEGVLKACYTSMHLLARTSIKASTVGGQASGPIAVLPCIRGVPSSEFIH
ncbi:hypothetical protein KZ483_21465 [Paenibacillus sp. sptzw28]|uniref:hypothetical protein n=1 Tax=Paenibacillus sp. sptzw28 TaxID=715179 RepID=UPI001C6F40A4|nr:hypothetical protein [Paenibacillus sp. sptzw28]QYR20361.1 hypothetical protein KZ483_21465 [Paenibacillus sp. sptzw28]